MDEKLLKIYRDFFKSRFESISATGKSRQKIWVQIDGKRVQATCGNNVNGEAIAIRTDNDEWFLFATSGNETNKSTFNKTIQYRKTGLKKKVESPIKILYITFDSESNQYILAVGGHKTEKDIIYYFDQAPIFGNFDAFYGSGIYNTGEEENSYIVSTRWFNQTTGIYTKEYLFSFDGKNDDKKIYTYDSFLDEGNIPSLAQIFIGYDTWKANNPFLINEFEANGIQLLKEISFPPTPLTPPTLINSFEDVGDVDGTSIRTLSLKGSIILNRWENSWIIETCDNSRVTTLSSANGLESIVYTSISSFQLENNESIQILNSEPCIVSSFGEGQYSLRDKVITITLESFIKEFDDFFVYEDYTFDNLFVPSFTLNNHEVFIGLNNFNSKKLIKGTIVANSVYTKTKDLGVRQQIVQVIALEINIISIEDVDIVSFFYNGSFDGGVIFSNNGSIRAFHHLKSVGLYVSSKCQLFESLSASGISGVYTSYYRSDVRAQRIISARLSQETLYENSIYRTIIISEDEAAIEEWQIEDKNIWYRGIKEVVNYFPIEEGNAQLLSSTYFPG
jgi:hypothetical protein